MKGLPGLPNPGARLLVVTSLGETGPTPLVRLLLDLGFLGTKSISVSVGACLDDDTEVGAL